MSFFGLMIVRESAGINSWNFDFMRDYVQTLELELLVGVRFWYFYFPKNLSTPSTHCWRPSLHSLQPTTSENPSSKNHFLIFHDEKKELLIWLVHAGSDKFERGLFCLHDDELAEKNCLWSFSHHNCACLISQFLSDDDDDMGKCHWWQKDLAYSGKLCEKVLI